MTSSALKSVFYEAELNSILLFISLNHRGAINTERDSEEQRNFNCPPEKQRRNGRTLSLWPKNGLITFSDKSEGRRDDKCPSSSWGGNVIHFRLLFPIKVTRDDGEINNKRSTHTRFSYKNYQRE